MEYDQECSEPIICHPTEVEDDEGEEPSEYRTNIEWPTVQELGPKQVEFDIDRKSPESTKIMHNMNVDNNKAINISTEFL